MGHARVVAADREQRRQRFGRVLVVVDHQDLRRDVRCAGGPAVGCAGASDRALDRPACGPRTRCPGPRPGAVRGHRAAVHLDDPLDERQADAEAAARASAGAIGLPEHVEHARQHLGMDADAGVADADHRLVALAARTRSKSAGRARCTSRCCSAGWRTPARAACDRRCTKIGFAGGVTAIDWPPVRAAARWFRPRR